MADRLAAYFAGMALDLHVEKDPQRVVQRIAGHAPAALGCDDAGIVVVSGHRRIELGATTSARVLAADRNQLLLDEGPSFETLDGVEHRFIYDTESEERWPQWCRRAALLGLRSVLVIRLQTNDGSHGSLNLYWAEPHVLDEDDVAVAKIFAQHASIALAATNSDHHLRLAMDARKVIGQAQGVLMERYDLDAGRAFEVLRRYSQDSNIKLRDVSQMIVERRAVPGPAAPTDAETQPMPEAS
jgi:GAF domain-containing protein